MANRNNIKPVFEIITFMVMILHCLLTTRAGQGIRSNQFIAADSTCNGIFCFTFFRVLVAVFLMILSAFFCFEVFARSLLLYKFSFFGLSELFSGFLLAEFSFLGFPVLLIDLCMAIFAIASITILSATVFVKLCQWFNFLARRALLQYDGFRHCCLLLINGRVFEPSESQPLCGFLYYITSLEIVK